jgi:hypothetical protein
MAVEFLSQLLRDDSLHHGQVGASHQVFRLKKKLLTRLFVTAPYIRVRKYELQIQETKVGHEVQNLLKIITSPYRWVKNICISKYYVPYSSYNRNILLFKKVILLMEHIPVRQPPEISKKCTVYPGAEMLFFISSFPDVNVTKYGEPCLTDSSR